MSRFAVVIFGAQRGHERVSGAKAIVQRASRFIDKHVDQCSRIVVVLEQKSFTDYTFHTEWYYEKTHNTLNPGDVVEKRGNTYFSTYGEVLPRNTEMETTQDRWVLTEPLFVKGTPSFALMSELQKYDIECVASASEAAKLIQGTKTFYCGVESRYVSGGELTTFHDDPLDKPNATIQKLKRVLASTRDELYKSNKYPFPSMVCTIPPSGDKLDTRRTDYIDASKLTEIMNLGKTSCRPGDFDLLDREAVLTFDFPQRLSMIDLSIWGGCAPPHVNPFAVGCPMGRGFFPYYGPNFTLVYKTKSGFCYTNDKHGWPKASSRIPDVVGVVKPPLYVGYIPCPFETQHAWCEVVVMEINEDTMLEVHSSGWLVESLKTILSQL